MFARCVTQAWRTGSSWLSNSSSEVMNAQPSKSSRANHSVKISKIVSSCRTGVSARRSTSACTQPFVQRSSRCARNASARSFFDAKLR